MTSGAGTILLVIPALGQTVWGDILHYYTGTILLVIPPFKWRKLSLDLGEEELNHDLTNNSVIVSPPLPLIFPHSTYNKQ